MPSASRASFQSKPKNYAPIDDPEAWHKLLNTLYIHEEDELFKWAKVVRAVVCSEKGKRAWETNPWS